MCDANEIMRVFKEEFIEIARKSEKELLNRWNDETQYTEFMLGGIIPQIAERMNLKHYPKDYYWLDAIIYKDEFEDDFKNDYFDKRGTYAKYLDVAIEHENNINGTGIEMNKLCIFNAKLRVLITYPNNEGQGDKFKKAYAKIAQAADINTDKQSILVIFGYEIEKGKKANWQFFQYTYDKKGKKASFVPYLKK